MEFFFTLILTWIVVFLMTKKTNSHSHKGMTDDEQRQMTDAVIRSKREALENIS